MPRISDRKNRHALVPERKRIILRESPNGIYRDSQDGLALDENRNMFSILRMSENRFFDQAKYKDTDSMP